MNAAPSRYSWVRPVMLAAALTALTGGVAWGVSQGLRNEHRLTDLEASTRAQERVDVRQDEQNRERYEQLRLDIQGVGAKVDRLLERQALR